MAKFVMREVDLVVIDDSDTKAAKGRVSILVANQLDTKVPVVFEVRGKLRKHESLPDDAARDFYRKRAE